MRRFPIRAGQDRPFTADEFVTWMEKSGWQSVVLAERIGVHPFTIWKWRNGRVPISMLAQRALGWANKMTRIHDRSRHR
jgi:hypothetical protein